MNAGDEIYVQNNDYDESNGAGLYSSFSGFYLFSRHMLSVASGKMLNKMPMIAVK